MRHTARLSLTLLLSVALLNAAALAEDGSEVKGSHRAITWQNPQADETLEAIYLVELSDQRMVSRILAETPGGRHVLLSQSLDAPTGVRTTTLVERETGWRAELETYTGAQGATLDALFRASDEVMAGDPVTVRLSLPDSSPIAAEVEVDLLQEMYRQFVDELVRQGTADRVAGAIPDDLKPALLFLARSLSPDAVATEPGKSDNIAHGFRDLVEVLTGAMHAAGLDTPAAAEPHWPMEVGPPHRGLAVEDPDLRALVAHFDGVEGLSAKR